MSALRINLLPAYIAEVRNTKVAIGAFSALFVAAVAGSLIYFTTLKTKTETREAEAADMTTKASAATAEVTKIKGEATALRAKIAPIKDKVVFVNNAHFYNTWPEKIYRRAAKYTDARVEYSAMAVSGGTLSMTGYAMKVDDLARYLITFYGNPDVTAVSVTGPPGWQRPSQSVGPLENQNPATAGGFGFTVTATLLKSLQRPELPASLNSEAGTTGTGGAGGAMGNSPGNIPPQGNSIRPLPGNPGNAGGAN